MVNFFCFGFIHEYCFLTIEAIGEAEVEAEAGILEDVTPAPALTPVLGLHPAPLHIHIHHPALTLVLAHTRGLYLALAHLGMFTVSLFCRGHDFVGHLVDTSVCHVAGQEGGQDTEGDFCKGKEDVLSCQPARTCVLALF